MPSEVCNSCGLPDELCVCDDIVRSETTLSISMEERSFNKPVTLIEGAVEEDLDEEEIASDLKRAFGCGGTVKNGNIELQGDHRERAREELRSRGFRVD